MAVTNYDTVNGEIIAQHTGGVQLDYLKDALGSVTAWVDQSCNVVATARYKPFGDIEVSTGTLGRFTWVGTLGYRTTGLGVANYYVRARHFASQQGLWNTVDRLWPEEAGFGYCTQRPQTISDPSGLFPYKCNRCAIAISALYWNTKEHYCFHEFIHCLVCCILGWEFGSDCAIGMQSAQAANDDDTRRRRMRACEYGAHSGTPTADCAKLCAKKYGLPGKQQSCQGLKPNWPLGGHLPHFCYDRSFLCQVPWGFFG